MGESLQHFLNRTFYISCYAQSTVYFICIRRKFHECSCIPEKWCNPVVFTYCSVTPDRIFFRAVGSKAVFKDHVDGLCIEHTARKYRAGRNDFLSAQDGSRRYDLHSAVICVGLDHGRTENT